MTDTGGSDPTRSLAVLWRTREPASRRGKPELGVDRIARAGIELADADGLAALSMRRVADLLGVGTMSIYTYVPGKSELFDVMVDTVLGEITSPTDEQASWRDRLTKIGQDNWGLFRRHPWLLEAPTGRPGLGPNVILKYELELQAIEGIGLSDLEMDSVLSLVLGHAEVSARRAVAAVQAAQQSGLSDVEWWEVAAPFLERVLDGSRFPTAGRVGTAMGEAYQAASSPEHDFEFGLARVLDGVAALLASRTP